MTEVAKTLVSATEAGVLLNLDGSSIRRLCREKKLNCVRSGGVWLVEMESINNFTRSNTGRKKGSKPRNKKQ